MNKHKRWLIFAIGTAFFLFLGFLAQHYFRERCLNYDSAYYSFKILQYKTFNIELGRSTSQMTQYLPVYAVNHNFPLKLVLKLYSVNFIINLFLTFLIILFVIRNEKSAVIMLLAFCLSWRGIFYYMVPEFHLGLMFSVLVYALIDSIKPGNSFFRNLWMLLLSMVFVWMGLRSHLVTIFCLGFVVIYQILKRKQLFNPYVIILTVSVTMVFIYLRYIIPISLYEKEKLIPFKDMLPLVRELFSYPSTKYMIHFAADHFLCIGIVAGLAVWGMAMKRKYLMVAFLILYPVVFSMIILITLYHGDSSFQYENYFISFGFFYGIPLIDLLYGKIRNKFFYPLLVVLLAWSLGGIALSHVDYTDRVGYVSRIMHVARTMPSKKLITSGPNYPWTYAWASWAMPFESALMSVIDSPDSAATFILEDEPGKFDSLMNKPNIFLGPTWKPEEFSANTLNPVYFKMNGGPYIKANSSQRDSTFREDVFTKNNFHLYPEVEKFCAECKKQIVIPIRIVNASGCRLNSMPDAENSVYMSYHLIDADGNSVAGNMDPLETDVFPSQVMSETAHGLRIMTPGRKGTYTVLVDMVTNNKRWWGINCTFLLEVK